MFGSEGTGTVCSDLRAVSFSWYSVFGNKPMLVGPGRLWNQMFLQWGKVSAIKHFLCNAFFSRILQKKKTKTNELQRFPTENDASAARKMMFDL